jgi:hypothetical protein
MAMVMAMAMVTAMVTATAMASGYCQEWELPPLRWVRVLRLPLLLIVVRAWFV